MKVKAEQLVGHLKSSLFPAYLITGDEWLLIDDVAETIRNALKTRGYELNKRITAERNFAWQDWYEEQYTPLLGCDLPQWSELRIEGALTDTAKQMFENYLINPPAARVLIVTMGKLDAAQQRSVWYKNFEKYGMVVPVWPLTVAEFPTWFHKQLLDNELKVDNEAKQMLLTHLDGNLLAARQELNKLKLQYGDNLIVGATLRQYLIDQAEFKIFDLNEAVLSGNLLLIQRIIKYFRTIQTEGALLVWSLVRELQGLATFQRAVLEGEKIETVLQKNRVFFSRKQQIRRILQQHPHINWTKYLVEAAVLDATMKGWDRNSIWWHQFAKWCLKLGRVCR